MITLLDNDFSALNDYIRDNTPSQILILVDENTHNHCLPILLPNLETQTPFEIIEIEAGEDMKSIETAIQLWTIFTEFNADRNALLINLGGGVITDIGGFVASTYKRGIPFVNIPTTVLGMCDASVGGKTGIDLLHIKNMVGTFAEPKQIFLYTQFLKTLPFQELKSGFAEMLKHALIADEKHWKDLIGISELNAEQIFPFIERSVEIKKEIVAQDFKEEHLRKTLNFGHTIGHAIESLFLSEGEQVTHGECVALGMICETELAHLEGLIPTSTRDEVIQGICHFFSKLKINHFPIESIINLMLQDKKNNSGNINFSLITQIGVCQYNYQATTENLIKCIELYKS